MKRTYRPSSRQASPRGNALKTAAAVATLALLATACGEDATQESYYDGGTKAGPQYVLSNEGGANSCMQDDWNNFGKGSPPTPSCTTNDINIARAIVTSVDGADFDQEEDELLCAPGDELDLGITLVLNQTAESPREDVGIWVRNDGGNNGRTGSCNHYRIDPVLDAHPNLFNGDGDACSGIAAQQEASVGLGVITAICPATGSQIQIGACVAWEVPGSDDDCPRLASSDDPLNPLDPTGGYRQGTLPANGAKCTCAPFTINVILVGSIIIEKQTVPDGATGSFTFTQNVDATGNFNLVDDGDKTFLNVLPGSYTVSENDPTPGFDLTNLVCDDANSVENIGTRTATINVEAGETVTCTFTNRQRGTVIIEKETDPDGATGSFTFVQNIDASGNFNLSDDGSKTFSNVVPGGYTVSENNPAPGFDLTNLVCDDANSVENIGTRTATINVEAGETVSCTFTNTQRAMVTVNKREGGGLPLTRAWEFQIRKDATTLSSGTVIAAGTAVLATGVVNFACSPNPNADCANDGSGVAKIKPGNYQLCEINMPAGWSNNITGFTPDSEIPEGSDNGNECINITLAAGATGVPTGIPDPIDNTPPPGGDARTIGYWKNHSCQAPGNQEDALSPLLPITVGTGFADGSDFVVNSCAVAVSLLDKRATNNGKKMASDAAYNLAAQLVAALLNVEAGAGTCAAATQAITDAQILLDRINFNGTGSYLRPKDGADYTTANNLAAILDSYNNNTLCPPGP